MDKKELDFIYKSYKKKEKYNKLYDKIKDNKDDIEYIELLYEQEKYSNQSLYEFKDIIPLFLSIIAIIISISNRIAFDSISFSKFISVIILMIIFSVITYTFLNNISTNIVSRDIYILNIIKLVKEQNNIQ